LSDTLQGEGASYNEAPQPSESALPTGANVSAHEVADTPDDTMEAAHDRVRPERGERGRFASNRPPAPSTKPRPQAWSADLDDLWKSLPPERQEFFAKWEGDRHQKITQLGERAAAAEKFSAIIERHRQVIGQNQPEQEIESLFQTKAALLRDPEGTIRQLAQQLGVNLGNTPQHAPANQEQLAQEAMRHLDSMLGHHQQQQMQVYQQRSAKAWEKFWSDKSDHRQDFEKAVAEEIQSIPYDPDLSLTEVCKMAYERVLKLNDGLRAKVEGPKAKEAAAKQAAEEKRKADEARRLASLNVRSQSGTSPRSARSIEAELEDAYDRAMSRG
jgi:hypothetical protein